MRLRWTCGARLYESYNIDDTQDSIVRDANDELVDLASVGDIALMKEETVSNANDVQMIQCDALMIETELIEDNDDYSIDEQIPVTMQRMQGMNALTPVIDETINSMNGLDTNPITVQCVEPSAFDTMRPTKEKEKVECVPQFVLSDSDTQQCFELKQMREYNALRVSVIDNTFGDDCEVTNTMSTTGDDLKSKPKVKVKMRTLSTVSD